MPFAIDHASNQLVPIGPDLSNPHEGMPTKFTNGSARSVLLAAHLAGDDGVVVGAGSGLRATVAATLVSANLLTLTEQPNRGTQRPLHTMRLRGERGVAPPMITVATLTSAGSAMAAKLVDPDGVARLCGRHLNAYSLVRSAAVTVLPRLNYEGDCVACLGSCAKLIGRACQPRGVRIQQVQPERGVEVTGNDGYRVASVHLSASQTLTDLADAMIWEFELDDHAWELALPADGSGARPDGSEVVARPTSMMTPDWFHGSAQPVLNACDVTVADALAYGQRLWLRHDFGNTTEIELTVRRPEAGQRGT